MNIDISPSGTSLTQEGKDYIRRRLENALREHATGIEQVNVWVIGLVLAEADESHYCLINVKLKNGALLACDGTDPVLNTAFGYALERVGREIARSLPRRREQPVEHIHGLASAYHKVTDTGHSTDRL